MGVTRRIGKVFKPFVNFPRWMGLNRLWASAQDIKKMVDDLKVHRPATRSESFEQAKARLHLTEQDIQKRQRNCLLLSIIYAVMTLIFFSYTIILIIHLQLGMFIGMLITILMGVFAYRESFWYFQMKTRTLGNTFQDWIAYMFRGGRK